MKREIPGSGLVVAAAVLIVALLLGIYVGGYFALGRTAPHAKFRCYKHPLLARIYRPLAKIESAIIGRDIDTAIYPKVNLFP